MLSETKQSEGFGRWTAALMLGAVLALGLTMRAVQMGESLWLDELHTAWTISGSLADVAPRARMGNNSPLYFYLPWLTTRWLGMNEVAVRLPSLMAGMALIVVVYGVAQGWTGSRVLALMAAALAALDRHFLFYSLEARPYVFVQIVGTLHVAVFWRLTCRPSAALRVAWIVGAVLLFYLHYTALLLIPAELVYYVIAGLGWRGPLAYRWRALLLDLLLVGLACLPAWDHLLLVASRRENWQLFVVRRPIWSLLEVFPLATYVVLPMSAVVLVAVYRRWRQRNPLLARVARRPFLLVACWLLVPMTLAWLTTQSDVARLLFRRYLMVVSVAPLMLSVLIGSLCPGRRARMGLVLLVVGVGCYSVGPLAPLLHDGRLVRRGDEDWRRAVRTLDQELKQARLPVFVVSGLIEADALPLLEGQPDHPLGAYCLLPIRGMYRLHNGVPVTIPLPTTDPGRLSADHWARIARAGGAWLLMRGDRASIDRWLGQLRSSAAARGMQVETATRREFVRRTDPFGFRRLLFGGRPGTQRGATRGPVTVTLVRLRVAPRLGALGELRIAFPGRDPAPAGRWLVCVGDRPAVGPCAVDPCPEPIRGGR